MGKVRELAGDWGEAGAEWVETALGQAPVETVCVLVVGQRSRIKQAFPVMT
jgi:hypothetical protein